VGDVDLLLAATVASVRMNRPAIVIEPPPSLAACERCREAYAQARRTIELAGGVAKWMEWMARWATWLGPIRVPDPPTTAPGIR
jgi:hypothetical protein